MTQRTGYCMTGTLGSNDWFVYAEGHLTELIYKFCYADQTDDYIDDMIGWYSGCAVTDCLYSSGYYLDNAGLTPENLVNGASGVCWACSGLEAPNVSGLTGFLYYVDTSKGYGAQNCIAVPGNQTVSGSDPAGKYTIRVSATCPYK